MDLSIAIPDSSLQDESTLLYKTKKVSIIARACAIFKITQIFIYKDKSGNKNDFRGPQNIRSKNDKNTNWGSRKGGSKMGFESD